MLVTRAFTQRPVMALLLAGTVALSGPVALPQAQALASALVLLFRGQTIQPVATDYAHLQSAYRTLEELKKLGSLQGSLPKQLATVSSAAAAGAMAGFTVAEPATLPNGIGHTPTAVKALPPTQVTFTLSAPRANAYFKSVGSGQTLPASYDGEQLIVSFPGVALVEYAAVSHGRLYVGQAGQLSVQAAGNATLDQLRDYLLMLPGLSGETAAALQSISAWQTTIPLGIPTDRAGWTSITVGGALGGVGVALNDNTGIGSVVVWQRRDGLQSFGVGGWGIKAGDVQAVASGLH
jgi:hypothetical protein